MKKLASLLAITLLGAALLSAQKIVLTGLGADMIPELKTIAPGATFVAADGATWCKKSPTPMLSWERLAKKYSGPARS